MSKQTSRTQSFVEVWKIYTCFYKFDVLKLKLDNIFYVQTVLTRIILLTYVLFHYGPPHVLFFLCFQNKRSKKKYTMLHNKLIVNLEQQNVYFVTRQRKKEGYFTGFFYLLYISSFLSVALQIILELTIILEKSEHINKYIQPDTM